MPKINQRKHLLKSLESTILLHHFRTLTRSSIDQSLQFFASSSLQDIECFIWYIFGYPKSITSDLIPLIIGAIQPNLSSSTLFSLTIQDPMFSFIIQSMYDINKDSFKDLLYKMTYNIQTRRYLQVRQPIARAPSRLNWLLYELDDYRFKQEIRISKALFFQIISLINNHSVFINKSKMPQQPIIYQMLVFMCRLGLFGNGASIGMIARYFAISERTVELYTKRCIIAILSIEKDWVYWPNNTERQLISTRIETLTRFPACVGLIDGSHMIFMESPILNGEDWFNRKGTYSTNILVICDDQKRIRYTLTGWPGSAHDQHIWSHCVINKLPLSYFLKGQYIIADSGYTTTEYLIAVFKNLPNRGLSRDEIKFNKLASNLYVSVEHCIGILKARFQNLKRIRILIRNKKDCKRICQWIRVCCILYNILLDDGILPKWNINESQILNNNNNDDENNWQDIILTRNIDYQRRNNDRDPGLKKREQLMNFVLTRYKYSLF